jgi:transcriptional regulator with XRE-family HTH domain
MSQMTPDIVRARATLARISINKVMKRAGVNYSTFCRWANGETAEVHPVTLGKIEDALAAYEAEHAA